MNCSKCNKEIQADWKSCPYCQTPINPDSGVTPPGGIIDSVVKADNIHIGDQHIHEAPDPTVRPQATHTGILCPICHRLAKDGWFECPECKEKYICTKHQDRKTYTCINCVKKTQSDLVQSSGEIGVGAVLSSRYKIESVIGEGGMGTVFKAIDLKLGRVVAIKCLSGHSQVEQFGIERFMQEAKSIASLSHLNIVQVYDVSDEGAIPFICMELVDGKPLDLVIKDKGKFSPKEALPIVKGIAQALSYAHKHKVIHRDVKPANIIQNSDGIVKLLDFGLARIGQSSDLSVTGYGLGTEAYASPEQKRDAKSADHRTDIFSLGATAYELLTNESPIFPRENKLPPEISNVIIKAMEPSVEQRYFTVDEFIKEYEGQLSSPERKRTVVTRDTIGQCIECEHISPQEARFCEECGAGLFEKCPSCKKEMRIGKSHCMICGVDINEFKQYKEHLDKGKDYLDKYKYSRALKEFNLAGAIKGIDAELQSLISEAESSPAKVNRLSEDGKRLFENENYEAADVEFRKALELDPKSMWLNEKIALIPAKIMERDNRKRIEESYQLLSEAIVFYDKEDYTSAEPLLNQAYQLNSESQEAKKLLDTVHSKIVEIEKKKNREECQKLFLEAKDNYDREDYESAEPLLKKVVELDPDFIDANKLLNNISTLIVEQKIGDTRKLAKVAFDKGDYDLTVKYIREIREVSPDDEGAIELIRMIGKAAKSKRRKKNRIRLTGVIVVLAFIVMAIVINYWYYDKEDYKTASKKNDLISYGYYLTQHPNGRFRNQVKKSMEEFTVTLKGHTKYVQSVAFSPDGKILVSCGIDSTVKLWDIATQKVIATLNEHSGYISSIIFHPDGKTLASIGRDSTIKIWDVAKKIVIETMTVQYSIRSIGFSPNGNFLASVQGSELTLWDVNKLKPIKTYSVSRFAKIAFSPNGKILASMGGLGDIIFCNLENGFKLSKFKSPKNFVYSVAFSPDGKILAANGSGNTIKLWDVSTKKEIATFKDDCISVAFSPNGKLLVSSGGGSIKFWDVTSYQEIATFVGYSAFAFSPDGKILATNGANFTIKLWNLEGGKLFQSEAINTESEDEQRVLDELLGSKSRETIDIESIPNELSESKHKSYDLLVQKGNQSMDKGNFPQATEYYKKALNIKNNYKVRTDYGACLHGMGLPQRAIKEFQAALKIKPNSGITLFNLGIVYYSQNKVDSAKTYFNKYLILIDLLGSELNGSTADAARGYLREMDK